MKIDLPARAAYLLSCQFARELAEVVENRKKPKSDDLSECRAAKWMALRDRETIRGIRGFLASFESPTDRKVMVDLLRINFLTEIRLRCSEHEFFAYALRRPAPDAIQWRDI